MRLDNREPIEIKYVGTEISGNVYVTAKGTYVIDINFDSNNLDLHSMTCNNIDGDPDRRLKSGHFVIVNDFKKE